MSKTDYIAAMLPHARAAIGNQHPWLVTWAIAKSGVETGWNANNVLIVNALNALGIKGGYQNEAGKWILFDVPIYYRQDSLADGRDDGLVPWRKFPSLESCFGEFVNMVNRRDNYDKARDAFVHLFENIYTKNTPGHAMKVASGIESVHQELVGVGLMDSKGRLV